jgi:hypothetical protein
MLCSALCLAHASIARAQPESPDAPLERDNEAEEPDRDATPSEVPEEPPPDTQPPPAPPPAPTAGEQQPGPYYAPEPPERARKLGIGPDFGITVRPAEGNETSYSPGFTWGAHLRIELASFLGLRAYFNNTRHAVDVPTGAIGPTSDTEVDQDDLAVTVLGARLEPTWVVTPELRLWVGAGIAWGRVVADEPSTRPAVASSDRSVLLELTGSLGASYDLIPHWLCLSLLVSGGVPTNQSGDVFDRQQVINQAGLIEYLGGLPEFESTFSVLAGFGLIL